MRAATLSASVKKLVRVIRAKVKTGDRAGAIALCEDALAPAPVAPPAEWPGDTQAPLPIDRFLLFPEQVIVCRTLNCELVSARMCVTRQQATDAQRTQQSSRGQGSDYPHCDTRKCQQGRAVREALDPNSGVAWRGRGEGWLGRFERGRSGPDVQEQEAARERLERVGLLDDVPTVDQDPDSMEEP